MKKTETMEQSYNHPELKAAGIRHCRAKNGDHYLSAGGFVPAGRVVLGLHGAVTALCDINGFGFAKESEFVPNAKIDVDGQQVDVMAHIVAGQIQGDFFARREGGFYCGNRKVASRSTARQIGCF